MESPVTRDLAENKIDEFIENERTLPFEKFPCHTQIVERMVKLVTEASSKVFELNVQDGFIRSTLQSHKKMPSFESKAE